jgi:anti-sigma regulatory factor (Ser/Thr protein kinase)
METPGDDQTCVTVKILDAGEAGQIRTARLSIPAFSERLVDARTFLQEHLATHSALLGGQEDFSRIVLAFVEALSNIIKHSYNGGSGKSIDIELRSSRNRLTIEITHAGAPFRPRSTPLPDPKQRREGGYGLYIMNRCFDQIAYETTRVGAQNILLVKHFTPAWQAWPPGESDDPGTS